MNHTAFSSLVDGSLFHDRYRIRHLIRCGNMGAVYEVIDEATNTPRALKVMLPSLLEDADLKNRFTQEAKITGPINSDHIVKVTDAGINAALQIPYLVMELLHGQELGSLLNKRGQLPKNEVVAYLYQAALALDKTHAAGVVHRDLKPENIFVTIRDDGSPCIKILDFGIAKLVTQGAARATRAMGTPLYMAPEQIRGDESIGSHTDTYALAHVAFALFTGEPYWMDETLHAEAIFTVLAEIMKGPREAPSQRAVRRGKQPLPEGFDTWFFKAAATNTTRRFERATDAIRALGDALGVPLPTPSWTAGRDSTKPARHEAIAHALATPLPAPPPLAIVTPPGHGALHTTPFPASRKTAVDPIQVQPTLLAAPLYEKTTAFDNAPPERTVTAGFVPPNETKSNTSTIANRSPQKARSIGSGPRFAAASTTTLHPPRPRHALFVVPIVALVAIVAVFLGVREDHSTAVTVDADKPATTSLPGNIILIADQPTGVAAPHVVQLVSPEDVGAKDAAPANVETVAASSAPPPRTIDAPKPKATSLTKPSSPAPTKKREALF